jgi:hypothetical protein
MAAHSPTEAMEDDLARIAQFNRTETTFPDNVSLQGDGGVSNDMALGSTKQRVWDRVREMPTEAGFVDLQRTYPPADKSKIVFTHRFPTVVRHDAGVISRHAERAMKPAIRIRRLIA